MTSHKRLAIMYLLKCEQDIKWLQIYWSLRKDTLLVVLDCVKGFKQKTVWIGLPIRLTNEWLTGLHDERKGIDYTDVLETRFILLVVLKREPANRVV